MIVELTADDLGSLMELERIAFPPEIQASEETYQKRFSLGHIVLGWEFQGKLLGVISFSYGKFHPSKPEMLPTNFDSWSSQAVPDVFDTAFLYNLGIAPVERGGAVVRSLVRAAFERLAADGCHQAVAEGPIPSYAGNSHIPCHPGIRAALDAMTEGGAAPDEELLFQDPHLALYRRLCPCRIIRVIPCFLPEDSASGGYRAMLYRNLNEASSDHQKYTENVLPSFE